MSIPIVPAILTDKKADFTKMLDACGTFADFVQIDIMDGKFVPSKSLGVDDLSGLKTNLKTEAHLMVVDPLEWIDAFKFLGSFRIIIHYEIGKDITKIINSIKKEGLEAGIALNPKTKICNVEKIIDQIDSVLFMSVNPGFYGAEFIPDVLEKIKEFKQKYPKKIAGIDGGVKINNIKIIAQTGVDYICVGSAILKADIPEEAYKKIKDLANE